MLAARSDLASAVRQRSALRLATRGADGDFQASSMALATYRSAQRLTAVVRVTSPHVSGLLFGAMICDAAQRGKPPPTRRTSWPERPQIETQWITSRRSVR